MAALATASTMSHWAVTLVLLPVGLGIFVGIPVVGMYREASAHTDRAAVWTAVMSVASVALLGTGPILCWICYTIVEVVLSDDPGVGPPDPTGASLDRGD